MKTFGNWNKNSKIAHLSVCILAHLTLSVDSLYCHVTNLSTCNLSVDSLHYHVINLSTCNLSVGSLHCHVTNLSTCSLSVDSLYCHVTTGIFSSSSCSRKAVVDENGERPLDVNGNLLVKGDSCDGDTPQS
jgi:hypothetical protein